MTDGRTSKYLYVESVGLVLVERRVVDGKLRTAVFGNGFSARARCELENASAPGAADPLGPCEYDYSGLPKVVTLEDLVDIVQDPPSESPVQSVADRRDATEGAGAGIPAPGSIVPASRARIKTAGRNRQHGFPKEVDTFSHGTP